MEGKPNQLYAQGMRLFEQYDEICKYFAEKNRETMMLMKFKSICNFTIQVKGNIWLTNMPYGLISE